MTQSQVQRAEGGRAASEFTYDRFMAQEGIPIYEDTCGVDDVTQLPRKFWPRLGGPATFVELTGPRESERGLFVAEIPGGKATEVQHHLYEQLILILQGRGLTEIWQEGQPKRTFEWAQGSLFAPPRNTYYRLISGSQQPVIFFAITSAARMDPASANEMVNARGENIFPPTPSSMNRGRNTITMIAIEKTIGRATSRAAATMTSDRLDSSARAF